MKLPVFKFSIFISFPPALYCVVLFELLRCRSTSPTPPTHGRTASRPLPVSHIKRKAGDIFPATSFRERQSISLNFICRIDRGCGSRRQVGIYKPIAFFLPRSFVIVRNCRRDFHDFSERFCFSLCVWPSKWCETRMEHSNQSCRIKTPFSKALPSDGTLSRRIPIQTLWKS